MQNLQRPCTRAEREDALNCGKWRTEMRLTGLQVALEEVEAVEAALESGCSEMEEEWGA